MDLDLLFAWAIAILAGAACVGALVVVLVAEWYALRRTIQRHRNPPLTDADFWRQQRALTEPKSWPGTLDLLPGLFCTRTAPSVALPLGGCWRSVAGQGEPPPDALLTATAWARSPRPAPPRTSGRPPRPTRWSPAPAAPTRWPAGRRTPHPPPGHAHVLPSPDRLPRLLLQLDRRDPLSRGTGQGRTNPGAQRHPRPRRLRWRWWRCRVRQADFRPVPRTTLGAILGVLLVEHHLGDLLQGMPSASGRTSSMASSDGTGGSVAGSRPISSKMARSCSMR
jgi:hypothetical protein